MGLNYNYSFDYIFIIPAVFSLLMMLSNFYDLLGRFVGISILFVILFMRYIVSPIYSMNNQIYFHSNAVRTYFEDNITAIVLMILEMIVILFVLRKHRLTLLTSYKIFNGKFTFTENNGFLMIYALIGLLSFAIFPSIQERTNLLFASGFGDSHLNTIAAIGMIFVQVGIYSLFIYFLNLKGLGKTRYHIFISFLTLIIALFQITVYWSESRTYVASMGIATVFLLNKSQVLSKTILMAITIISLLAVISLSGLQMFEDGAISNFQGNVDVPSSSKNQFVTDNYQAYFGGNHLIALTSKSYDEINSQIDILVFFNEIIGSITFVRQIIPPSDNQTTVHFNYLFGHTDENTIILPMLGQSYLYFGFFGSWILSFGVIRLLVYFEIMFLKSRDLGVKFAFLIGCIWLGLFPMQNINIISATIFNVFGFTYLLFKLNERFKISL